MSIGDKLKNSPVGQFWLKYDNKIILAVGIVLIAAISFEAGFLQGQKNKKEPVIVNRIESQGAENCQETVKNAAVEAEKSVSEESSAVKTTASSSSEQANCAYVASKNSNKYHLPTCQFAKKIKPENKVCFSSAEDAQKRGFQGAKCCIK